MESCLYVGQVRHRRFTPVSHAFRYRLFMVYLDLDELGEVFRGRWLWSATRPAVARFRREDHYGDPDTDLSQAIRDLVAERTGTGPDGPIRLLTHLRYFGYCFNPISCYYCFAPDGEQLKTVVLEVNNIPWKERCMYVLELQPGQRVHQFIKEMHVSPFMAMDMRYHGMVRPPGRGLSLHLENWREEEKLLDATLALRRRSMTGVALAWALLRFPLMTARITAAIHWQALRLWRKGVPYHPHPGKEGGSHRD